MGKVRLSIRQLTYLKENAPLWYEKVIKSTSLADIKSRDFVGKRELSMSFYPCCILGELDGWTATYRVCSECEDKADSLDDSCLVYDLKSFSKYLIKLLNHDRKHRLAGHRDANPLSTKCLC